MTVRIKPSSFRGHVKCHIRTVLRTCVLAPLLVAIGTGAAAAPFPEHPIRMVIPYAAGGSTDVVGRFLAQQLGDKLGQPVIVENRVGAGTAIGAQVAAQAKPDGYTWLFTTNSTFTINPAISPRGALAYDSAKDFEPVAIVADAPLVLAVKSSSPIKSMQELLAGARAEPGKLAYASFGAGTGSNLVGELLKTAANVDLIHVPYTGGPQAMNAVLAGDALLTVNSLTVVMPHIKAGTVRPLAVTTRERLVMLPQVPTLAELGYPSATLEAWNALVLPKGTSGEIRTKLADMLTVIMKDDAFLQKISDAGLRPRYLRVTDWAGLLNDETTRFRAVADKADIRK